MAHGTDDFADSYVDEKISISDYSLSASVACGKITCAVEEIWGIL
jgi:rRNA small subunit pseudouridine methyltransferase Nep1